MSSTTIILRASAIACLLSVLAGCTLLGGKTEIRDSYDLTAPTEFPGLRARTGAQILVKKPNALKAIDSERIVLRSAGSEITYLAGAQWTDAAPDLVQSRLVEAFENSGATGAVAKPGDGLVIDYQLVSELRRFEVETDGAGRAIIEMSIKLLSDRSGKVLETQIFTATAPIGSSDGKAYAAALDRAFDVMARDIVDWVLTRI